MNLRLPSIDKSFYFINLTLVVLSAVFLLIAGFTFVSGKGSLKKLKSKLVSDPISLSESNAPKLLSLQEYQRLFTSKNLFRPLAKKITKKERVVTIDDVTRDIVLIGVVTQDQLEAIVKNVRTRQTYFVRVGATVGQLKVEEVHDQKIVVSYNGERKTLFIQ